MPLAFKPHSVSVVAATKRKDIDKTAEVPLYTATPTSVSCDVQPISSESAYRRFGVEVSDARNLLCELADFASFPMGARVTHESETFVVVGRRKWDGGWDSDHGAVLIERI